MASHNRRRSSIDRAAVESILTSGETGQPMDSPKPHVGNSSNRDQFPMLPPPRPLVKHVRALSYTPRRPNRLSLSFPVATAVSSSDSTRPTPTSSTASSFPPTPADASIPSPNDPNGYLVALASQERRVLELKEELHKAETDLTKLKIQWANHERTRKRAEIRHIEPLRPLQTPLMDGGRSSEEIDASTRQSLEQDRRKAIMSSVSGENKPRRKVITGGHTRTLSLLSPDRSHYTRPFPSLEESGPESNGLPRSTTMPDTSQGITKINTNRARHSYQGVVTHGAKQIAEDVKAGLWTFLEDLRQATVGEEATVASNRLSIDTSPGVPKKKGSKGSLRSDKGPRGTSPRTWDSLTGSNLGLGLSDVAVSPRLENNPSRLSVASKPKSKGPLSLAPVMDDLDDNWSNWDSPTPKSPRWSGSTDLSDPATPSHSTGEDRPIKIIDQSAEEGTPSKLHDEIQWPALDKLTPGNLKRTVSTIMKEWEKSLTPPTHEEGKQITSKPSASDKAMNTGVPDEERAVSQLPHF